MWFEESPINDPDQALVEKANGDGIVLLRLWLEQSGLIGEDGTFFFREIPNTPRFLVGESFPEGDGLVFVPDVVRRIAGLSIPQVLIRGGHIFSLDAVDNFYLHPVDYDKLGTVKNLLL
ncbi:MAG: hypothetical protein Q7R81_04440 [Candidatus Peregrinibacteria bacterium]|nr:hypothetical protein [Candidatus Peregrinibacteria bacterium]